MIVSERCPKSQRRGRIGTRLPTLDYLAEGADRTAVANSQDDGLLDALNRNAGVDPATYGAYLGALFKNPRVDARYVSLSPLSYPGRPNTPNFLYHALADEFAPIEYMREPATRYCGEGLTVRTYVSLVGEHIGYVLAGFPIALDYLAHRFAGTPAPSDC